LPNYNQGVIVDFMRTHLFTIVLLLVSCETFTKTASKKIEAVSKSLVEELREVHSKEDFVKRKEKIRTLYLTFADLLIESAKQRKEFGFSAYDCLYTRLLQEEAERVRSLDGCKEFLELVQRDAVHKIDIYDRKSEKQEPYQAFTPWISPLRR